MQKLYDYAQSELDEFNNIYEDNTADQPYTDPAFIAYIKGEDTPAPCTFSPRVTFVKSASDDTVYVPTSAPLAQRKVEKLKPRLITQSHVPIPPRVNKAQDQIKTSSGIARHEDRFALSSHSRTMLNPL